MTPRDGAKYSTDYYKQTPHEYTRVTQHVIEVIIEVVRAANELGVDLDAPLKGFPRTKKQANYSAMDIMADMLKQTDLERDLPSGIVGRWNRLFEDNPEYTIDLTEQNLPNPIFNRLFSG
jgi:hypothetical protein